VKTDRDEPARHLLRSGCERLLALALAEVQLCGRDDEHLDDAVGQLPRHELVEPDPIEAGVLGANSLQDLLPDGWVNTGGFLRAAGRSLALRWRVGRDHFLSTTVRSRGPKQRHVRQKSAGRKCSLSKPQRKQFRAPRQNIFHQTTKNFSARPCASFFSRASRSASAAQVP
jgi:hypothetical protein